MAQQLGPSSFVREVAGVASQAKGSTPSGINRSIGEGGGQFSPSYAQGGEFEKQAQINNAAISSVLDFANKLAEPTLLRKQQEQFVFGMQQAAEGKALGEIKKEQPWLSKIVGDTFVTQGARKYTVTAETNDFVTETQMNMPELRKMSPDEFSKYLRTKTDEALTGDAEADAEIMTTTMNNSGPLMLAHAKANFEWNQDQLEEAYRKNIYSAGRMVQSRQQQVARKEMTQELADKLNERDMAAAVAAPANLDPTRVQRAQGSALGAQAQEGNFVAIKALSNVQENTLGDNQDPEEVSGRIIAMRVADERSKVTYLNDPANQSFLGQNRAQVNLLLKRLDIAAQSGDEQEANAIREEINNLVGQANNQFKQKTGSQSFIIDPANVQEGATYTAGVGSIQRQLAEEQSAQKRAGEMVKFAGTQQALAAGSLEMLEQARANNGLIQVSKEFNDGVMSLVSNKIITADEATAIIEKAQKQARQAYDREQKALKENPGSVVINSLETLHQIKLENAKTPEERRAIIEERVAKQRQGMQETGELVKINNNEVVTSSDINVGIAKNTPDPVQFIQSHPLSAAKSPELKTLIFAAAKQKAFEGVDVSTPDGVMAGSISWAQSLSILASGSIGEADPQLKSEILTASSSYNTATFNQAIFATNAFEEANKDPKYAGYASRAFEMTAGKELADKWRYINQQLTSTPGIDEKGKKELYDRVMHDPSFQLPNAQAPINSLAKPPPETADTTGIKNKLIGDKTFFGGWFGKDQEYLGSEDNPVFLNAINEIYNDTQNIMKGDVSIPPERAEDIAIGNFKKRNDLNGTPFPISRQEGTSTLEQIVSSVAVAGQERRFDSNVSSQTLRDLVSYSKAWTRKEFDMLPKADEQILEVSRSSDGYEKTGYTFKVRQANGEIVERRLILPEGLNVIDDIDDDFGQIQTKKDVNGNQFFTFSGYSQDQIPLAARFSDRDYQGLYRLNYLLNK